MTKILKTIFIFQILIFCHSICSIAYVSNTGTVLSQGQKELKIFSSIYSETKRFDALGTRQDQPQRSSFWSNFLSLHLGITSDFTGGVHFEVKSAHQPASSFFSAIGFSNSTDAQFGLTSFGPSFKWKPLEQNDNLSLGMSFTFPVKSDLDGKVSGRPGLDSNGWKWSTSFFYNYPLSDIFSLFFDVGFNYAFDTASSNPQHLYQTPSKAFFSYSFYQWTFYLSEEFTPTWSKLSWSAFFFQTGLGIKYSFSEALLIESLYSKFLIGKNGGAGSSLGVGLTYVF